MIAISNYISEAVAKRSTGKYIETIKMYDDFGKILSVIKNAGILEYYSNVLVDDLEHEAEILHRAVYKSTEGKRIYLCVPDRIDYVLRFGSDGSLMEISKIVRGRVQRIAGLKSFSEWADEINEIIKREHESK